MQASERDAPVTAAPRDTSARRFSGGLHRVKSLLEQLVSGRRPWWSLLVLLLLYVSTASYARRPSIDVTAAEAPAWALANYGTLDLTGLLTWTNPWFHEVNGGLYSDRFPGAIAYLVPGYWIAGKFGLTSFSLNPGIVTAAIVTAAGVSIFAKYFRREFEFGIARNATLLLAFGSGAWSLCANAPWSHSFNFLLIACLVNAASRGHWTMSGLFWGLAVTTRPTMAVGAALFGILASIGHRSIGPALKVAAGATPGVLGLLLYNYMLFDRFAPTNGLELSGDVRPHVEQLPFNVLGALVSPSRGILIYYPILLVTILLGVKAWRSSNTLQKSAFLAGIAVFLTQLTLNRYSGGYNFWGPRLAIEPMALAAPLLVVAGVRASQKFGPRVVWMVGVTSVVIHGGGAILTPY